MVAADAHDSGAGGAQREQRVPHDALRVGERRGRLEQVAGDEHDVDGFAACDLDDLGEHRAVLVETRVAAQRLADVPVGGVQDPHDGPAYGSSGTAAAPDRGRDWRPARSDGRVAHAGNGNSTTSGTGISGCITNIVPGLAIVARFWCVGGRKPYSGRFASAGSRRPTTRIDEFEMMRRSTSLAVCCAPISTMPSERPRSATSSRISLIGESPSRGAYLLSSSSTTNSSGLRAARLFLAVERGAQRDADDEALGPVGEVVQVDDGDLRVVGLDAVAGRFGDVGAHEPVERALRRQQPAHERVDRAHAGGRAGPLAALELVVALHLLDDHEVDELAVGAQHGAAVDAPAAVVGARMPLRFNAAGTLCTTIVYCWRSSSASANTNGKRSSFTNSAIVQ